MCAKIEGWSIVLQTAVTTRGYCFVSTLSGMLCLNLWNLTANSNSMGHPVIFTRAEVDAPPQHQCTVGPAATQCSIYVFIRLRGRDISTVARILDAPYFNIGISTGSVRKRR